MRESEREGGREGGRKEESECLRRGLARHGNYRYWCGCFPSSGNMKKSGDITCKCVLFSVPNYATWTRNKDTVAHGVAFRHVWSQRLPWRGDDGPGE